MAVDVSKDQAGTLSDPDTHQLMHRVIKRFREIHPERPYEVIWRAYEAARDAHEGQYRKSGRPYIVHPVEVAGICVELHMQETAIVAALLHDVVEDTTWTLRKLEEQFSEEVAELVDGLTKIRRVGMLARARSPDRDEQRLQTLQKLFLAMAKDLRVMVIKLSDRLANMRTLEGIPEPDKRERIARETRDIYVPIARRLGLFKILSEMEDLCFKHLNPERYRRLRDKVDHIRLFGKDRLGRVSREIRELLEENGIRANEVQGRVKHLCSIAEKMDRKDIDLGEIYDILAVRVVLDGDEEDCYRALGLIHNKYKPIFHRFRDFIARAKENGYRSLHTTVFVGEEEEAGHPEDEEEREMRDIGRRIEVQIRTERMHVNAEYGVAAHWIYKGADGQQGLDVSADLEWLELIRDLRGESESAGEFMRDTQVAVLQDQIMVLSPAGQVLTLPRGSTPVDYAYGIHTELGHACRRARVNGREVPLDYKLDNGDVVTIIKSDEEDPNPDPTWVRFAKSPKTVIAIRKWLRKIDEEERAEIGRKLLREEVEEEGLYPLNLLTNERLFQVVREFEVHGLSELFEKIALGRIPVEDVVDSLKQMTGRQFTGADQDAAAPLGELKHSGQEVTVDEGTELGIYFSVGEPVEVKTRLSECCLPVPGDEIYGIYRDDNQEMVVHRQECPVLDNNRQSSEPLDWRRMEGLHIPVALNVLSLNRVGLLFEVLQKLSEMRISFNGGRFEVTPSAASEKDPLAWFQMLVEVRGVENLNSLQREIASIDDVLRVERAMGLTFETEEEPVGAGE